MKGLFAKSLAVTMAMSMVLTGCGKSDDKKADSKEATTLKMLVPGYDGGYLKKELVKGSSGHHACRY